MNKQSALIRKMESSGILSSSSIKDALMAVDRKNFVRPQDFGFAYQDRPLSIGNGQTISQPSTVVFMLELLAAVKDDRVLDAGSGSGWTTALLSHIVGPGGKVFAVELLKEIKDFGEANYLRTAYRNACFIHGNAAKGLPDEAPFDRILVSAGAKKIPPLLLEQLAVGGNMVIPLQDTAGNMVVVKRENEKEYTKRYYPGFAFVPFIDDL